ncbi:MAG: cbb3-type cytochrome oxidase assembly protein CcoS [Planctomycetota bacterium]
MSASTDSMDTQTAQRKKLSTYVHAFFILACSAGGCMFVFKLFSFMKTLKKEELMGFAYDPIIVYGFVAMGFLFLLGWAFLSGQFRDIEAPKHEMLERFIEQERAENALRMKSSEKGA